DSRYNCILSHNQSETEGFVRDYTQSRFGHGIEYNTVFRDLTQDASGVTARVIHTDRDDEEELIHCQYLVAADGINSRVRRGLGVSGEGQGYTRRVFPEPRRPRSLPDGGAAAGRAFPAAPERSR